MTERLSRGDLATLSLLDPDQGRCPRGHGCRLSFTPGVRTCEACDFRGAALICWDITSAAIDVAAAAGASASTVVWARSFVAERS